jgi:hypothetical protein
MLQSINNTLFQQKINELKSEEEFDDDIEFIIAAAIVDLYLDNSENIHYDIYNVACTFLNILCQDDAPPPAPTGGYIHKYYNRFNTSKLLALKTLKASLALLRT